MRLTLPLWLRRSLPIGLVLLIAGCATVPGTRAVETESPSGGADAAEGTLPNVELDAELLYQLLLGEFAIQREDYATAAEALAEAAKASQDFRVADRATRAALSAENYRLAKETAGLWAELRPGDPTPLEVITITLVAEGRVDEARDAVAALLDLGGETASIYHRLTDMLSRQPNREGALVLMSRLIEQSPEDAELYYAQASLAARLKRSDLVLTSIDHALEIRPGWEDAALSKAVHLVSQGAPKEVVIGFCSGFLGSNPDAGQLRTYFARYLVDQGELDQGFQQFSALVKRDAANADALYAAGLLGLQLERLDEAEGFLKRNLELKPNNDQARLYLGQLAYERKRFGEAEQWYRSVQTEAYQFEGQLSLGEVLAETHDVDAALDHLQSLHPANQEEYVRWVLTQEQVLRRDKQLTRAKEILDSAVDRFPEDTELIYARGLLAAQLEMLEVHERDMRKLLVKDPANAHALNALGYTLADITDRYEEAQMLIEQALSIRPEDPFILDSMGWVQYRLGNHADAIDYLERALAKRQDAEIAAHLGEVLWVNGEHERAKQVWRRALKQNPDNDVLLKTLKKFNQ